MRNCDNSKLKNSRTFVFPYLTGFITASVIFLILFVLLGYRIGFSYVFERLHSLVPGRPSGHEAVMKLPQPVVKELTEIRAVVRNAGNPTKQPKHDTILVHPEDEIGYLLNPNVTIFGHMLKSTKGFNFDPPVLYLDKPYQKLSDRLKAYISAESRLENTYSTDENGLRVTLPSVTTDRSILMVGDSVAFGVGVDDDLTAASCLQRMLGEQYRVINAGVGGYRGNSVF